MNGLVETAKAVQQFLDDQSWESCIIGGLATLYWGEARLTRDVDVTLLTGWGREEPYVEQLLKHYESRIEEPVAFAVENRVLLLSTAGGTPVDVSLGALPFEKDAVERATEVMFGNTPLRICTAEDLVVMKAFANRQRDWIDIEGVLKYQGGTLDRLYVLEAVEALASAKPNEPILERLTGMLAK